MSENSSTTPPPTATRTPVTELLNHGLDPVGVALLKSRFENVETLAASLSRHEGRVCDRPDAGPCPWHEPEPLADEFPVFAAAVSRWEQVGWVERGLLGGDADRAAAAPVSESPFPGRLFDRQLRPISYETYKALKRQRDYLFVALTEIVDRSAPHLDLNVSTVWLGHDHGSVRGDPPDVFETMLRPQNPISKALVSYMVVGRYSSETEAMAGHMDVVEGCGELFVKPVVTWKLPTTAWPSNRRRTNKPLRGLTRTDRVRHGRQVRWPEKETIETYRVRGRHGNPCDTITITWPTKDKSIRASRTPDPTLKPIPGGSQYHRRTKARARRR